MGAPKEGTPNLGKVPNGPQVCNLFFDSISAKGTWAQSVDAGCLTWALGHLTSNINNNVNSNTRNNIHSNSRNDSNDSNHKHKKHSKGLVVLETRRL